MPDPLGSYSQKKREAPPEYQEWEANPSDENYNNLMGYLKPTIDSGMASYAGGRNSLRTRANILASESLNTFDPEKASLKTHVFNNLKRLQRYQAERGSVVHVPENVRVDSAKIYRYTLEYKDKTGNEPSNAQIADHLGMSAKRVQKARYGGEVSESQTVMDKGDLPGTQKRTTDQVWADYVYHDLDSTNQKIFEWTLGYGGAPVLSKKEIAYKLKISPAAVSQRSATIRKQLEKGL
jgi:DNA-directed RNA polymerase specialized sigma subunit